MIKAAGVLYLTPDRQALFLKRGNGSDHPLEWCWPGGQLEDGEDTAAAALRESAEECGFAPARPLLAPHTRSVAPAYTLAPLPESAPVAPPPEVAAGLVAPSEDVDFTTFICRVEAPFPVTLCDEHTGWAWASIDAPPEPLHPGARIAIERLGMNELGVARAMADGRLSSPQKYENVWLFNIRISGTGTSYRPGIKQFVSRPADIWLSDDMLARCNGLATIWEHPDKSLLNSDEYNERAIGSIFLPYVRPDVAELWGIAKVYDADAAHDMAVNGLSTSPAVNFSPGSNRLITVDGRKILLETDPSLVDHIAICSKGVWDKEGPPAGVESVMADSVRGPKREPSLGLLGPAVAAFRLNVASRALSARR